MEVDEEDDCVVQEIPVFLTQPENPLYLFQYLNHPAGFDMPHKIVKSCLKPENQEVELELELDHRDSSYSRSMGEQLALNCDGFGAEDKDKLFKRDLVDRKFLKSERIHVENNNLTVGLLHDKKLTLAPLSSVLALKPHLPYLDKTDRRAKQEMKDEGEGSEPEVEEENSIVKAVTVKFARRENERMKKAREKSFNFVNAKAQEESWIETRYCDSDSKESKLETNKFKASLEDRIIAMTLDKDTYLQCLIPLHDDDEVWKKDQIPCLRQLKTLPLADQIRCLLRDVKIISTPKVKSFLERSQSEDTEIKKHLQQFGLLVWGNWVVKSEVLYPKDTTSALCGVPAETMCRTRDFMVYLFTQHEFVQKPQVSDKIRIPPEELSLLFGQIAQYSPGKGWKLMLPPDEHFIAKNPELVKRSAMWFQIKHNQINETLIELAKTSTITSTRKNSRSRTDSGSDREGTRSRKNSARSRHDSASDVENSGGTPRKRNNSTRKDSSSDKEGKGPRTRKDSTKDSSDVEMGKPAAGVMGSPSSLKRNISISAKQNGEEMQDSRRRRNNSQSSGSEWELSKSVEEGKQQPRKKAVRRRSGIENLENAATPISVNSSIKSNSR